MEKKELLDRVFRGEDVPRVPVGFWFHFLEDAETGDAVADPGTIERNIAGHRAFIENFQPDMVKVMSDGFFRYPVEGPLESVSDLSGSIREIDSSHPWIQKQLGLFASVSAIDPKNNYFYNVFSPLTTLRFMVGYPKIKSFLKESPSQVSDALRAMGQGLSKLAGAIVSEHKGMGIYLSVQNPDISAFSDAFYEEYVAPSEKSVLASANAAGGRNILHICGYSGVRNNVAFFGSYEAEAFNWAVQVEGIPLSKGRGLFPGKALIGGFANPPGSLIHTGNREGIQAFTKQLMEDAGNRSLVIGADCTVPNDISLERLRWVREAAIL
ncbi:MAG: uroporphyrinogen decarboxylase [Deltaproteobacteria bacterium]|jgi:uroporphyrinogen decarboxylase|nr:uroporphyrinogen decarboxylase [Deltaproteobacteria bacterium]